MTHPIRRAALIACFAWSATAAVAATTATQTKMVQAATNFGDTLTFSKFDPSLGTLTGVDYTLTAGLQDVIGLESLDPTATTISGTILATVTLERPDGSSLGAAQPGVTRSFAASGFDGAIDFGGTSGITFDGMGSTIFAPADHVLDTAAADLALFSGPGAISLPVTAVAQSSASGSGNVVSEFQTDASAGVTVFYTYTPTLSVSEPVSLAMLGVGMVGLGVIRRR